MIIIIKENGLYKQIIHIQNPAFDYKGDWLPWRINYTENSVPYLFLEGMRMCVYYNEIDCKQIGGDEQNWYDFCQDKWIQTPNEGVLMVLAVPNQFRQPPR